jgi:Xaa-Pro aminopeptidase
VAFKKDFAQGYEKFLKVEQAVFEATKAGAVLGEVLRKTIEAYAENGLEGEWENHHQGSLTGYMAREIRVGPDTSAVIKTGQAFAWNSSAAGAKCEDTVFLGADGFRLLTEVSSRWPALTAGWLRRPDIMRL